MDKLHYIHIFISIASLAILGVAGLYAFLLYLQNQALKNNPKSALLHLLPSIETMETRLFQIIIFGFFCLSVSLGTALGFIHAINASSYLHKILFSLLAWLFFAILIYQHYRSGWRGKTALLWTLAGFVALLLAYLSSKWIFL